MLQSILKVIRGIVKLRGASDNTLIGNNGDRLKVDAAFTSATTTVPSWSKKLRYEEMTTLSRGTSIATSTTWTTIYSYTGSGFLAGFLVNVETFSGWEFRFLVDGDTIFSLADTDITGDAIFDLDDITDVNQSSLGLSKSSHDRLVFHAPLSSPIYFGTSVTVQIRRPTAGAKKFQAGLVVLSKET
jgi:hypothetical protein